MAFIADRRLTSELPEPGGAAGVWAIFLSRGIIIRPVAPTEAILTPLR